MGRQVICQDTQIKTDSKLLYKAENNKYYSSQEVYETIKSNNIFRQKALDELFDILDYNRNTPVSTYLFKEVKKYEKDYELLYRTVEAQKGEINFIIQRKTFGSEIGKIKYVMAIIDNNIQEEAKLRELINKKRDQIKQEKIENIDCVNATTKKKGTDVSHLLGEEDWI